MSGRACIHCGRDILKDPHKPTCPCVALLAPPAASVEADQPRGATAPPTPEGTASHALKTWPPYFQAVADGLKTFEIRKNDRDFRVGDRLILGEFDPETQQFTGRVEHRVVSYITDFPPALVAGYVVLGMSRPALPEGIADRDALVAHMKKHVSEGGSGGLIGCRDAADAIIAAGFRRPEGTDALVERCADVFQTAAYPEVGMSIDEFRESMDYDETMRGCAAVIGYLTAHLATRASGEVGPSRGLRPLAPEALSLRALLASVAEQCCEPDIARRCHAALVAHERDSALTCMRRATKAQLEAEAVSKRACRERDEAKADADAARLVVFMARTINHGPYEDERMTGALKAYDAARAAAGKAP